MPGLGAGVGGGGGSGEGVIGERGDRRICGDWADGGSSRAKGAGVEGLGRFEGREDREEGEVEVEERVRLSERDMVECWFLRLSSVWERRSCINGDRYSMGLAIVELCEKLVDKVHSACRNFFPLEGSDCYRSDVQDRNRHRITCAYQ